MSYRGDAATAQSNASDRRLVLFVASIASFLSSVMGSAINIAIPTIGKEFAVDAVTLSWIATGFLLAVAVFMVPAGKMADIYGRKRLFLWGIAGWTLTSLLCGLATSAPMLVGLRVLQGIAGAMFFGNSTAIVTSVYPPQERGRALGILVATVYTGLAIGPTAGGVMTQQLGWRSMFFVNAILGIVIVTLILWKLKGEWAGARGEKLDILGSVIFGISLLSIIYGLSSLPAAMGGLLILFGMICLAIFVAWEIRIPNPVMNIGLFRHNVAYGLSNAAALISYASTAAIAFLLSLYLQYVRALDPQTAGLVLLAQPAMMAIFSPLAGRLSDRVQPRIVASAGMTLSAVGLGLMILLNDALGLWYIVGALLVAGLGFALFSSPNTNAVMGSVERSYLGVASATLGVMRSVGMMFSMGIATLIMSVYVGGVQITPQYHDSFSSGFRLAFIIFTAMCLAGIFCSLARGKVRGGVPTGRVEDAPVRGR